jgi:hypothetical protein
MRQWILLITTLIVFNHSFAQTAAVPALAYPKVVGYISFVLPLVKINKDETTNDFENFSNNFAIGFPVGLNILYSEKFGFSFEISPTIKAGNGTTKTNNITFSPGPMFRFKHGFTFIPRLAFETSGRYGFTPVFNKTVIRTKPLNYFISLSLPARFGNNELPSIGLNLQFGVVFN